MQCQYAGRICLKLGPRGRHAQFCIYVGIGNSGTTATYIWLQRPSASPDVRLSCHNQRTQYLQTYIHVQQKIHAIIFIQHLSYLCSSSKVQTFDVPNDDIGKVMIYVFKHQILLLLNTNFQNIFIEDILEKWAFWWTIWLSTQVTGF
jgi:hypothetical protein